MLVAILSAALTLPAQPPPAPWEARLEIRLSAVEQRVAAVEQRLGMAAYPAAPQWPAPQYAPVTVCGPFGCQAGPVTAGAYFGPPQAVYGDFQWQTGAVTGGGACAGGSCGAAPAVTGPVRGFVGRVMGRR